MGTLQLKQPLPIRTKAFNMVAMNGLDFAVQTTYSQVSVDVEAAGITALLSVFWVA